MHTHQTTIRLHNTDAGGRLFFAEQFRLAHDAYESFMESAGYPFAALPADASFLIPIVHARADFLKPLFAGDRITIRMTAEKIGDTSFTLGYTFLRNGAEPVGTARTVHVLTDKKDGRKHSLVPQLREKLAGIAQ
ncbi:MAG TPA: thioesterase family protein [Acidobacteriota bacterium]|nr:thioesterase family protein [Acidobacteriota bacterium]